MFKSIKSFVETVAAPFLREIAEEESFIQSEYDASKAINESYVTQSFVFVTYEQWEGDAMLQVRRYMKAVTPVMGGYVELQTDRGKMVSLSIQQILRVD